MHIHNPFPLTEQVLSLFVAWLHSRQLAAGKVKNYLAAVRHTQIALGLMGPRMGDMPQLEYVIRGVKRMAQVRTRVRLPITLEVLKGLKWVWQKLPNQRDASMLWAAATMCFFGFLRTGEVVVPTESTWDPSRHLVYGDLRIDSLQNPQVLEVHIKASKTDPYHKRSTSTWVELRRSSVRWRQCWTTW